MLQLKSDSKAKLDLLYHFGWGRAAGWRSPREEVVAVKSVTNQARPPRCTEAAHHALACAPAF